MRSIARGRRRGRAATARRTGTASACAAESPARSAPTSARRPRDRAGRCRAPTSSTHVLSCAALTAMNSAKSSSQSRLRAAEAIEPIAHARREPLLEAIEHARPERLAMRDDRREVDVPSVEAARAARLPTPSSRPSSIKRIEADEQRIAGKRGKALVRRIAVAGRAERQHLPQALTGRGERVDELERARRRGRRCRSGPAARSDGGARRSNEETSAQYSGAARRDFTDGCGVRLARPFLRLEVLLEQLLARRRVRRVRTRSPAPASTPRRRSQTRSARRSSPAPAARAP